MKVFTNQIIFYYTTIIRMKSYEKILKSIGCSDLQIAIFEILWKYWAKPASTIAKIIWAERTHVYKMLQQMVSRGIVAQSEQYSVMSFFIPSPTVLDSYYQTQQLLIDQSRLDLPKAYEELDELWSMVHGKKPLYRIREWHEGMKQMMEVMIAQLKDDKLAVIKLFSLSTLETTATTPHTLKEYAHPLFYYCTSNGISIQTILGTGIMIPEHISHLTTIQELEDLPAGQSSLHVFIVWTSVYYAVFKTIPLGFKRDLPEMADLFHFLAKMMGSLWAKAES